MSSEMRDCPFCGLDVTRDEGCFPVRLDRSAWEVRCGNVNCFAHDQSAPTRDAAIAKWNRRALLTRTEAGAVKCSDCDGDGETCLAGRSAHRSNWIKCAKCNGTGDAAPVADGAVPLWISCHWREDLARDSVVSVVNRQDPAHTLQVYVSTHPHDASDAEWNQRRAAKEKE